MAASIPAPLPRFTPKAPPYFPTPISMRFSNKAPLPFPPQLNNQRKRKSNKLPPIPSPPFNIHKLNKNGKLNKRKKRKKIKKSIVNPAPLPPIVPLPNQAPLPVLRQKAPIPAPIPMRIPIPAPIPAPLPNKAPLPKAPLPKAPLPNAAPLPAPIPLAMPPVPAPIPNAAPLPIPAPLPKAAPLPAPLPIPNAAPLPAPFPFVMPPLPNAVPKAPLPAPLPKASPLRGQVPMPPPPPMGAPLPPPPFMGMPPPLPGMPPAPPLFPMNNKLPPPPPIPMGPPPPPPLPIGYPNTPIHWAPPPIPNAAPIPLPPNPFQFHNLNIKNRKMKKRNRNKRRAAPIPKNSTSSSNTEPQQPEDNSFLSFESVIDDEKFITPKSSDYAVNYTHVKTKVSELTETIETTEEHNGNKLLEIFNKIEITSDHLSMWVRWSGGSFPNKESAHTSLKTVIDYAEKNPSSPLIKQQLRVITKLIIDKGIEKSEEYVHFILLLATHGKVCNVMKDIAINNAYGMMTQSLNNIIKLQTLENIILLELRNYRHILVEKLHLLFKFGTNQHTVNGFYNQIAPLVGLNKYIDNHLGRPGGRNGSHYKKGLDKRFFSTLYNKENIIKRIYMLIDEKKIGYQKIVKCLEDNCPKGMDKMELLQEAIDIDTGKISENYLCWMLEKLNIFGRKAKDWKEIQKCWDDIK